MIIYVTRPGDSVYKISQRYGVPMSRLISDNMLEDILFLPVGLALIINDDTLSHTVKPGQSIYSIARIYGVSPEEIIMLNPQISSPSDIVPGEVLKIPMQHEKLAEIHVNGYAYTNISPYALNNTLPSLTYVSPFSYEVSPDGTLNSPPDTYIVETARKNAVAPMMVVSNLDENGSFDSSVMPELVNNNSEAFFNNVLAVLQEKNYYGVNLDFEFIPQDLRENYNNFVADLKSFLTQNGGYILTEALAPKTRADQPGILYESHDYNALGKVLDKAIIMTYEWGYTYGPPQAVAPLNEVERVIRYAVTEIPRDKIMMSIPNYGYDWTLPYKQGTAARTVSYKQAVALAVQYGADIMFDEVAKSPYFNYVDNSGTEHVVWFEDARSVKAKLELIDKYSLSGVSYWTINQYFKQMYMIQDYMFDVVKLPL